MKSNRWFYDTFLASLFERAGTEKGMWLSRKQTAICTDNMERHTARFQTRESYGEYWSHDYYTTTWNGRKVDLSYSKKNGCGMISFGLTKEEGRAVMEQYKAEKLEHEKRLATIRYTKKRDRWEQIVAELRREIEASKEHYREDLEDFGEPLFNLEEVLMPLEQKLEIYLSVAK